MIYKVVRNEVRDKVGNEVRDVVGNKVRDVVWNKVGENNELWKNLSFIEVNDVKDEVLNDVREQFKGVL